MIRSIVIGLGMTAVFLGIQFFCFQELIIKTDREQIIPIEAFMPYSLVCFGLVLYFYGYQLHKT